MTQAQPKTKKPVNPYARYASSEKHEVQGVFINYGEFKVRVAKAGGANTRYLTLADKKYRIARRQGTVGIVQAQQIAHELLIEACITDWQVKNEEGKFVSGITLPDGKVVEFNQENVGVVLNAYKPLAQALLQEASADELFLDEEALEAEAGN